MTAFLFTEKITKATSKKKNNVASSASFGDGYSQVAGIGLKPTKEVLDIIIEPLTKAEVITFNSFIATVGIWGIVTLTPPYENISKSYRLANNINLEQLNFDLFKYTLSLEEV